jgi:CPA2 family monovalent cation:H+ antiporter-2
MARVVNTVRRVAPTVPVLVRTRYLADGPAVKALGAQEFVAEEVEGALEMIARTLRLLDIPRNVIDERLREVRAKTQTSERRQTVPRNKLSDVPSLADLKVESVAVRAGSRAAGASAVGLRLRSSTGALMVAVQRGERTFDHPPPSFTFETDDVVYLVGTSAAMARAISLFEPEPSEGQVED